MTAQIGTAILLEYRNPRPQQVGSTIVLDYSGGAAVVAQGGISLSGSASILPLRVTPSIGRVVGDARVSWRSATLLASVAAAQGFSSTQIITKTVAQASTISVGFSQAFVVGGSTANTQASAKGFSTSQAIVNSIANSTAELRTTSSSEVVVIAIYQAVFFESARSAADSVGAFVQILASTFKTETLSSASGYHSYGLAYKENVQVTAQTESFFVQHSDAIVRAYSEPERDVIVYAHAPME
jgi:hypothetical protein